MQPIHIPHVSVYSTTDNSAEQIFYKERLVIGDVTGNIANISIQTLNKSRQNTPFNRVVDWFKGFFWKPLSLKLTDGETTTILVNINSAKQRLGLLGFNPNETTRILNKGTLLNDVKERILQRDVEKEFARKEYVNANALSQNFAIMMVERNLSDEQVNELLLSIESSYENGMNEEQLVGEILKFDKKLMTEGLVGLLRAQGYNGAEELAKKIIGNRELLISHQNFFLEIHSTKDPEKILSYVKERHFKDKLLNIETLEEVFKSLQQQEQEYRHKHMFDKEYLPPKQPVDTSWW